MPLPPDLPAREIEARYLLECRAARHGEETLPEHRRPHLAMQGIGIHERHAALGAVHLRRYEAACSHFGWSAHWQRRYLEASASLPGERRYAGEMLQAGILSGDADQLHEALRADAPPSFEEAHPGQKSFHEALDALLRGDLDRAREAAERARAADEARRYGFRYYSGIGDAVIAILDRDEDLLRRSLHRILDRHTKFSQGSGRHARSVTGLICEVAACLLVLANREGIDATVDPKYHSRRRKLLAVALEGMDGHVTRGQSFHVKADLLPRAFVDHVVARSGGEGRRGDGR